ncbi:sigma-54-dependent transcriptional regulator [Brevundimonas sp.]|uniref:sigma-54-dependent transcriptional regulator n=1 Tax=Brevundimonas sp. TaxID=1871086 RepID=UPI0035ADC750
MNDRGPPRGEIVLVDDDDDFRAALAERLMLADFRVRAFHSGEAALKGLGEDFAGVVVTDLRMPGMDGRQLLSRLQTIDPDLPVIMITGHGEVADAVAALRAGAYDFVEKPFAFDMVAGSLRRALEKRTLVLDNRRLAALAADSEHDLPLMGDSSAITALNASIAQIADARMEVLIEGETGTGKEAVARALHRGGRRRLGPFVAVNCGALPEGLIESELFGHELGAFAGALRRRVGHIERAHNGTLFLDEADAMPRDVQVKLLRVIEEREILPIGAAEPRVLDLRILASTKVDLADRVQRGGFREDLYYRLDGVRLRVPPLRERRDDLPLLFTQLLRASADRHGAPVPALDDRLRRRLMENDWSGNIRELASVAERVVLGLEATEPRVDDTQGLTERMARLEGEILRETLIASEGDIARALAALKLPRKTFYDKLTRHGLKPADFRRRTG